MGLNKKYVFHVPLYKYENEKLIHIDVNNIVNELINQFNENGYYSFYISNVKSYYKSRCFNELIITLFTRQNESLEILFRSWFNMNNHILSQEAFAYECNNELFIEDL